jgi:predicted RNA methylase
MELKLSQRRKVPVLTLNGSSYAFPVWKYRYLRAIETSKLHLDDSAISCLGELQRGFYKPPFSLRGKVVLDVGACCGETAWYFLRLGANKVICVESDSVRIATLESNKRVAKLNIEVVAEPFRLEHLFLHYDFVKVDVEGQEVVLLDYLEQFGKLKPCVLEAHSSDLRRKFEAQGFRLVVAFSDDLSIMSNFSCYSTVEVEFELAELVLQEQRT